jgi:hypothetical protein
MILLVQRLLRNESDADTREFVRGVTGSADPKKTDVKIAGGLIAGYLASRRGK